MKEHEKRSGDSEAEQPLIMGQDVHPSTSTHFLDDDECLNSSPQLAQIPSHVLSTTFGGKPKVYKRRFIGLAELVLLNIVVSWDWILYAPVSRSAASYFNTTESAINWLSTAFMFAFVVATPATFFVLSTQAHSPSTSARTNKFFSIHGPKASIVCSACLLLCGNWIKFAGAKTNLFWLVTLGQMIVGLAQPFVLAAPTTYSDMWFTESGRTTATAIASLANPFGAALGQLISPFWVTTPADVPNATLYIAIIATGVCLPAFFIPAQPPVAPVRLGESVVTDQPGFIAILQQLRVMLRRPEFYMIFLPFTFFVAAFNATSSLLNQILEPYGFTEDQAGIAGAILIVVGLIAGAVTSPLNDKFKFYLWYIRIASTIVAVMYLILIWVPSTRSFAFVAVVMAILGASSFGLVPVALEFLVEILYPMSPSVHSSLCWSGGQLFGGIFIIVMDALKANSNAKPPLNMHRALVFQAVICLSVLPAPLFLGLFGRQDKIALQRLEAQKFVEIVDEQSTG